MLVEHETLRVRVGDDERKLTHLRTMGKNVLLLNLMRSLYTEANVPLEIKPHHNEMFNVYSHRQDDMCGRPRDTTPIEIPSQLYAFHSLREYAPHYNVKKWTKIHTNCIVEISDAPSSVANSLLLTCRDISQNQPITDLNIHKLHCDTSQAVPAEVLNLSKTVQSIIITDSRLPRNLMEHLISQLQQCRKLRNLYIENILVYNSPSKQTSQEQICDTKMSAASSKTQNQFSKWRLQFRTSKPQGLIMSEPHSIGDYIASEIGKWGNNHPLQQLTLINCFLSGSMLLFISKFKMLTHLNLNENKLGNAGIHIAKAIENMGFDSPLRLLSLRDCLIPSETCGEILKSLSLCCSLTHLDLGGNDIGRHIKQLGKLFEYFRVGPPLQQLYLPNCLIPEVECTKILKYLPKCRHLTHLNLDGNNVGKGGMHIIEMIDSLGSESPLQLLYLRHCSIPPKICGQILKCLMKCKQLTDLDVGGHNLANGGDQLVELIRSFEVDSPLQLLYLANCSIAEVHCTEMLRYLSKHRHLTHLNLSGNRVGKAGMHIVEIVERAGIDSPLQLLYLRDCSIPTDRLQEILKSLKKCKQLTNLDIGGHNLEYDGEHLVELIKNSGMDPPLQELYLPNCLLPQMVVTEMVNHLSTYRHIQGLNLRGNNFGSAVHRLIESIFAQNLHSLDLGDTNITPENCERLLRELDKCKILFNLSLGGNNLTGQLSHFFPNTSSTLPSLRNLVLTNVGLSKDDVIHLKTLLESGRMPALGGPEDTYGLWLDRNNLVEIVFELEAFLNACLKKYQKELKIALRNNNLSDEFVEKWTKRC